MQAKTKITSTLGKPPASDGRRPGLVRLLLLTLLLGATASLPAAAQVTVGSGSDGNYGPFGGPGSLHLTYPTEYQQIYSSTAFSGPIAITSIGFASYFSPGPASYTVTIGLSTTPVFDPSTVFADNRGADYTTVFTGTESTVLTKGTGTFDLVFPTDTFTYDPSAGNLLVDFQITSASAPAINTAFLADYSGSQMRRVDTFFGANQTDHLGLVTQFNGAPSAAPEPSSVAAFAFTGLGTAGLMLRARKRRAAA